MAQSQGAALRLSTDQGMQTDSPVQMVQQLQVRRQIQTVGLPEVERLIQVAGPQLAGLRLTADWSKYADTLLLMVPPLQVERPTRAGQV